MAASLTTGWTAASLLPSLAAGYAPGSAWSLGTPAQVTSKPNGLKAAAEGRSNFRAQLMNRVLGKAPAKPQGINPAVNSTSTKDFSIPAGIGAPGTEFIRGY